MTASRRTYLLPSNLAVTVLRLPDSPTVAIVRAMLAAELYILCGRTRAPHGADTGYGSYVGTSDALRAQAQRVGVSLCTWTYRLGRLDPDIVVLIRSVGHALDEPPRLLVEAGVARAISRTHTILNTRTAAPTAAKKASREQRLWAIRATDEIAELMRRDVLHRHPGRPEGGSTREQLVRLVLAHGPMDVDDLLAAARDAGLEIAGGTPAQRTRRDVTTRELGDGAPRLYRTHINRRAVVYPAGMSLRAAREAYQSRRGGGTSASRSAAAS